MSPKEPGIHSGHRQRLKDRFLKAGLDHFEPHNALELLLFFGIPQKDTNPIAHQLLKYFGSFSAVFDAPYDDLLKIKGMTRSAATLIKLMPAICRMYDLDKSDHTATLNTTNAIVEYIKPYFKGKTVEELYAFFLDSSCKIIAEKQISVGGINFTSVDTRKIIETAISTNCVNVIIAHNHPFGLSVPSSADMTATVDIARALKVCQLTLLDHIIISPSETLSMMEAGYYSYKKI